MIITPEDPRAVAAIDAIRAGDLPALGRLLGRHPELARAAIGSDADGGTARSLLHIVTDWPGHLPAGAAMVRLLVEAGADVDARFIGPHAETALHWAASSDDVEVLDALLDAGADIEADGAVIGRRTAISDAAAFGQWNAARRLLARGASTTFWEAATLGLLVQVEQALGDEPPPSPDDITAAFWGACHGGHLDVAQTLLERGADLDWIGWDGLTPLDAASRSGAAEVVAWLERQGARSAAP